MITRGIRALVSRDWAAVRAAKDRYWGDRIARLGAAEGLRIADDSDDRPFFRTLGGRIRPADVRTCWLTSVYPS